MLISSLKELILSSSVKEEYRENIFYEIVLRGKNESKDEGVRDRKEDKTTIIEKDLDLFYRK